MLREYFTDNWDKYFVEVIFKGEWWDSEAKKTRTTLEPLIWQYEVKWEMKDEC